MREGGLNTICEEAKCPNRAECWREKTATFLILGSTCTRGCSFCAVKRGGRGESPENEPQRVASAVKELGITYAVVTSVTRDDLPDGGASIFAQTAFRIGEISPAPLVEFLIPDFSGENLLAVINARPTVIAHNIETVKRLSPSLRHPNFTYEKSLSTLSEIKKLWPEAVTKSSLLLGLGESRKEVLEAMEDLRGAGVDILVAGQYLQPTPKNTPVAEYLPPDFFTKIEREGIKMGFAFVAASPFSRTSHLARQGREKAMERLGKV